MTERVLVTGGTGFIGRHLVSALQEAGHHVEVHSSAVSDISREAPQCSGDTTYVFHLAGRAFVPDSWTDPGSFYAVNVQGTVNVLEFCRRHRVPLTILSSYVYGIPQRLPIDEEHPLSALNPYAHTKILAEDVARFYEERFHAPVCIVRPFNVYGEGQAGRFLIPHLIQQAIDPVSSSIEVDDLAPRRDYLHVRDLVSLLLATMSERATGAYNAGSGSSISVDGLASMVRTLAGTEKPIVSRNRERPSEIPDVVADSSRARIHLGWNPKIALKDGIAALVDRQIKTIMSGV